MHRFAFQAHAIIASALYFRDPSRISGVAPTAWLRFLMPGMRRPTGKAWVIKPRMLCPMGLAPSRLYAGVGEIMRLNDLSYDARLPQPGYRR